MASVERVQTGWRVVWREGGKKQYERFDTERDAREFRGKVEAYSNQWPPGWVKGRGEGDAASSAPLFGQWAARSVASRSTANERTRHDYQRDVDRHLTPTFGSTPVDRVTPEQVGAWLIEVQRTLSPKSVKNVHNLASSIMNDAIAHQLAGVNPFKGRMRGQVTVKQEEMVFLTQQEFDTLLRHIPAHYRPLVLLLAHTGLRWSEATALRVSDVDLLGKKLQVVRAWKRTPDNRLEIGEPKTRRSRRTVVFSSHVADALIPLVAGKGSREYVFTTLLGHPVRNNNFRLRAWSDAVRGMQRCAAHTDAVEPCGCLGTVSKTPRIHDLRHSHASWLLSGGASLVVLQRRLGHESIQTTVDRYTHLLPDSDAEVGAILERWSTTPQLTTVGQ